MYVHLKTEQKYKKSTQRKMRISAEGKAITQHFQGDWEEKKNV